MSHTMTRAKECVAFRIGQYDTHAAMSSNGSYTIPIDGTYIYHDKLGRTRQVMARAGYTLQDLVWIVGEHCGVFFHGAQQEVGHDEYR